FTAALARMGWTGQDIRFLRAPSQAQRELFRLHFDLLLGDRKVTVHYPAASLEVLAGEPTTVDANKAPIDGWESLRTGGEDAEDEDAENEEAGQDAGGPPMWGARNGRIGPRSDTRGYIRYQLWEVTGNA